MKLLFEQKNLKWFDKYNICDEAGNVVFMIKSSMPLVNNLTINDAQGNELATIVREFSFLPSFAFYRGDELLGIMSKKFAFFTQQYEIDYNGWRAKGDFLCWDYQITDGAGRCVAEMHKESVDLLRESYCLDVTNEEDALGALMVALAIDLEGDAGN